MQKRKLHKVSDYPEILEEWDYELNTFRPDEVSAGSEKRVHWICKKGHRWEARAADRTSKHRGCPYCANKRILKGYNDLATTHPHLVEDWDFDSNDVSPYEISYGSTKKVLWKCKKCGEQYEAAICDRVHGNGCPYCSGKRVKKGFNDLESKYPEIAKEWDYEKNGNYLPSDFTAHSTKSVWWKCPKNHSYQMVIGNRTGSKQLNCPICSGKRIVKGINDLFTIHPELKERWDYEKNDINPETLGPGSNTSVYWKCEKNHSFCSTVYCVAHSRSGMNCPVCRNFRVDEGTNDLTTTHPKLLEEWDYDKNEINPNEVHAGMHKKVWWKCKAHGHSWQTEIQLRTIRGLGCPYCSNQKLLVGFNDVGTLHPEIYKLWDYSKNNGKTPADFTGVYSNKKIYLICQNGHPYKTSISEYHRGRGCPVCSNKKVIMGVNDLATTHPDLAKEWDLKKNGELTPQQITHGSQKKVWWKCQNGHSWKAIVYSRAAGTGCPECLKEYQTSLTEKTFTFYLSKYFSDLKENVHLKELGKRELDIYIPSLKLAIEYDGHNWHKNPKSDLIKDEICNENGITIIRIREDGCIKYSSSAHFIDAPQSHGNILILKDTVNALFRLINELFGLSLQKIESVEPDITAINESFYSYHKSNSLAVKCPNILKEWDYDKNGDLKPESISAGSSIKVWWKCEKGHSWNAVVSSRVRGNGCPYCSGKYVLSGFNDLASQYPSLIEEWDYDKNRNLKPEELLSGANLKVWWKCKKGHRWEASISSRTRQKTKCPTCSGLIPDKGRNDLATLYPELVKEWDYDKNGDLKPSDFLPGSEKVVWWICPKGHSYDTQIFIRAKVGCGCPICSNKRVLKGYNDLETLHPELAKEWDYDKNDGLLPSEVGGTGGSHKEIWWKCEKGHSWKTKLSTRIGLHSNCPQCAIDRSKKRNK